MLHRRHPDVGALRSAWQIADQVGGTDAQRLFRGATARRV